MAERPPSPLIGRHMGLHNAEMTLGGIVTSASNKNGNGLNCPGTEAAGSKPIVRNTWTTGNAQYKLFIDEASGDAWPVGTIYKIDLFGNNAPIATLFFKNDTAAGSVEGVKARIDLGAPVSPYNTYTTIVTRLNGCP
ncbi:MAG: hypothetical protein IH805_10545 [Proteobacteria bacterium]|nr:hypothetical protein [Pseudomonadota bacterium]